MIAWIETNISRTILWYKNGMHTCVLIRIDPLTNNVRNSYAHGLINMFAHKRSWKSHDTHFSFIPRLTFYRPISFLNTTNSEFSSLNRGYRLQLIISCTWRVIENEYSYRNRFMGQMCMKIDDIIFTLKKIEYQDVPTMNQSIIFRFMKISSLF